MAYLILIDAEQKIINKTINTTRLAKITSKINTGIWNLASNSELNLIPLKGSTKKK